MKQFLLHSFLCVAMVMAPWTGWSDTIDELWTEQEGINSNMEPVFVALNNEVLAVEKILKFIAALPYGVQIANQIMNDEEKKITPFTIRADNAYIRGLPENALLGLVLSALPLILVRAPLGDGSLPFKNLSPAKRQMITRASVVSLLFFGSLGFASGVYRRIHGRGSTSFVQSFLLNAIEESSQPCDIEMPQHREKEKNTSLMQQSYLIRRCLDVEEPYGGRVLLIESGMASGQLIQVHADQGEFVFHPDKKIFEKMLHTD